MKRARPLPRTIRRKNVDAIVRTLNSCPVELRRKTRSSRDGLDVPDNKFRVTNRYFQGRYKGDIRCDASRIPGSCAAVRAEQKAQWHASESVFESHEARAIRESSMTEAAGGYPLSISD